MKTKKQLSEHVLNQIKEIEKTLDLPTKEEFNTNLKILIHQIRTFAKPLQDQIKRLKKYEKNYKLHKDFPFLRTTNTCERWFGQTKPEKVKKGFKTKKGLLNVLKALAVKITKKTWKTKLQITKDIENATKLLISTLVHKKNLPRPA